MRCVLPLILTALLAGVSTFAWREHERLDAMGPVQHKAALLTSENESLRSALLEATQAASRARDASRRGEIEHQVSRIRGLSFLNPVVYESLDRSRIGEVLNQKIGQQYTDKEMADVATGYSAIGLLPRGFPLKATYLKLLGEQLAAFYDQHVHKLFMFRDSTLDNSQNRVILAHELTHALQDQNFNLLHFALEAKHDDDAAMAASALVEGDATLVMTEFMAADASWHTLADTVSLSMTQNMKEIRTAPAYLRESLVFPYIKGQQFCLTAYQRGGYAALSRVYARPPSSTAQILHPELYFNEPREEPIAVNFLDTKMRGQDPLADDVLGEFGCRILFEQGMDTATADAAAAGWRGDRYLVYGNGDDLVWKTVWRSAGAAAAAGDAFRAACAHRFGGKPAEDSTGGVEIAQWPGQHVLEAVPSGISGMVFVLTTGRERADDMARTFAPRGGG